MLKVNRASTHTTLKNIKDYISIVCFDYDAQVKFDLKRLDSRKKRDRGNPIPLLRSVYENDINYILQKYFSYPEMVSVTISGM